MVQQTAVEWLLEQLEGTDSKIARVIGLKKYNEIVRQAKAMEKEQILKSRITAPFLFDVDDKHYINEAEQYYNETYGSNETTSPNN
jgi:hypothetical protein